MEGKGDKLISAIAYKLMIDPDFTKAIVNKLLKDLATKEDLEKLRKEVKEDIKELRNTFNTMLKWIIGLLTTMWVSIVVGIIAALVKLK